MLLSYVVGVMFICLVYTARLRVARVIGRNCANTTIVRQRFAFVNRILERLSQSSGRLFIESSESTPRGDPPA